MNNNHKHSWVCADNNSNDKIVCEKCEVDYDKWHEKMIKKGYTEQQLKRFENE